MTLRVLQLWSGAQTSHQGWKLTPAGLQALSMLGAEMTVTLYRVPNTGPGSRHSIVGGFHACPGPP